MYDGRAILQRLPLDEPTEFRVALPRDLSRHNRFVVLLRPVLKFRVYSGPPNLAKRTRLRPESRGGGGERREAEGPHLVARITDLIARLQDTATPCAAKEQSDF